MNESSRANLQWWHWQTYSDRREVSSHGPSTVV